MKGDCNICANRMLPSYSTTCMECGLLRKNYKPITNADRVRNMDDYDLAIFLENVSCKHADTESWLDWLKQEADENHAPTCKSCGGTLSEIRYHNGRPYRHCFSCHFEFYEEEEDGKAD